MPTSAISASSTMGSILSALPGAKRALFARYHLGGCQSCAFSNDESLAELCQRAQIPVDEVLQHLLDSHHHDQTLLIDARDLEATISSVRLIDIRTREEHEAVAIQNSEFFTQELQQELFAGDPESRLVLYDHRGDNVLNQVAWFRGHGLKQTFGLNGGIDAWSREVEPSLPRYRLEMDG